MNPRKGARRRAEIPPEVLAGLNAGTLETASLAESLAIDFAVLLGNVVPKARKEAQRRLIATDGVMRRMAAAGELLLETLGLAGLDRIAGHPSDTVRGWAPFMVAAAGDLTLAQRLDLVRPLADDAHFGVRECAWLAVRPHLAAELDVAIKLLCDWTSAGSANLRRFASESTRPRGVWCAHIKQLKQAPALGLPLLEPLRADPEKYVQDSVANWLNDASKSQPEWVRKLCRRWQRESKCRATERICKRAQRSMGAAN